MTERERFLETMSFGSPDRPPYREMPPWPETIDRWHAEGYPKHADFRTYFGFDRYENIGVEEDIHPVYAEDVVEETDTHIIKRDWRGVRVQLAKGSRSIPFFHGFPVTDRESFREFAKRLDADTETRFPLFWDLRLGELRKRTWPVYMGTGRTLGFFGPIREWVGAETLLMGFYDDPAWIEEMMEWYADFIIRLTGRVMRDIVPDCVHFFEDMAYRGGMLISPDFFRKFMMKPYRRVIGHLREQGVPFIMVDSDGLVDELIPLFIELGLDGMYPFEVQAGMDIVALRRRYGRELVIWGGIDKRVLARSQREIEREVSSKLPLMLEQGGFIPTLDHETPPDVSFDNFRYYRECVRRHCENG